MIKLTPLEDTRAVKICQDKVMYETKKQAELVARRRMILSGTPLYVYHCKVCFGHHLTKKQPMNWNTDQPVKVVSAENDVPAGATFGRFTVIRKMSNSPARYECMCKCGRTEARSSAAIRNESNRQDCCTECRKIIYKTRSDIYGRTALDISNKSAYEIAFSGHQVIVTGRVCNDKPVLRIK